MKKWVEKFVPEKDLFFVEEKDLSLFDEYLNGALVVPFEEFLKHSSYKQIQMVNSYTYWNISSKAKYVIVAHYSWITNLTEEARKDIFSIQYKMGRGMILPLSLFPSGDSIPPDYIIREHEEKLVVIQHRMWEELPYQIKEAALLAYSQEWDSWICHDVLDDSPIHIRKYANTHTTISGSNCLSATLFAITAQEWILKEWVHHETFFYGLKNANYDVTNDEMRAGDVVTWIDENRVIHHASFYIGNSLFFNKNGQTVFNPYKIIRLNELNEQWGQYRKITYRKK
ncbi:hypothetical protein KO561_14600 [Radiobacillus kanasensis]|uniref:hypothetical protein n=1 Tax=Radiobacillus kanasensis TaxID=2844358 RepID=UPI001E3F6ABB|nr:hypothetical protein [Radiobacillus kanasensis]UFT98418.1 hypothetical protein KO561_14600 [Radiobacillus kanasensis]